MVFNTFTARNEKFKLIDHDANFINEEIKQ